MNSDPLRKLAQAMLCVGLLFSLACRRDDTSVASHGEPTSTTAESDRQPTEINYFAATEFAPVPLGSIESQLIRDRQTKHEQILSPSNDGWKSEAFGAEAQQIVDRIATIAFEPTGQSSANEIASYIATDFVCSSLRPSKQEISFEDNSFCVKRSDADWPANSPTHQGRAGATKALSELTQLTIGTAIQSSRVDTKTIRVSATKQGARTVHILEAFRTTSAGLVEQHFQWTCDWTMDSTTQTPKLSAIHASDYEESTSDTPLFSDRTSSLFANAEVYRDQLRHGLNYWLDRIETTHGMYIFAEYGIAVGDVNGDNLEDVYICQPGGLPNRLLVRSSDGTLEDRSAAAGVNWLDHTSSALLIDFDNDGDQDLAVAVESKKILFMQNDGEGVFSVAAETPIDDRHVQGLSAADFDNDGRLDVYLTVGFADGNARPSERRPSFVYHDANEGGANVLLQNRCSNFHWHFADVTAEVGLDQNNRRHSLAASWEDFDNDGDQDLYVANDYGQNCLYENINGTFRDIAVEAGLVDFGSGMSVSWSDYDNDGLMDLYVGNMFSSAGNRITRQAAFQRQVSTPNRSILARFAKGNSLFRNKGNRQFEEIGNAAGIERGRWAWSSLFCDINNDGHEDVFVANGYITNDDERDL